MSLSPLFTAVFNKKLGKRDPYGRTLEGPAICADHSLSPNVAIKIVLSLRSFRRCNSSRQYTAPAAGKLSQDRCKLSHMKSKEAVGRSAVGIVLPTQYADCR